MQAALNFPKDEAFCVVPVIRRVGGFGLISLDQKCEEIEVGCSDDFSKVFEAAMRRGVERMAQCPAAIEVKYDPCTDMVYVLLKTGLTIAFKYRQIQGLENAKPEDMDEIEISPSGHGLYFPLMDVDVHLPSLLEGHFGVRK